MKIALTRYGDLTTIDGVNRYIYNLAEYLLKKDHKVLLLSNIITSNPVSFGREVFGVELKKASFSDFGRFSNSMSDVLTWYTKGSRILKSYDVVIMNGIVPISHKRKVGVLHHPPLFSGISIKPRLYRFLYNKNKINVCVSNRVRYDASLNKINCSHILNPPIKLELFSASKPERIQENGRYLLHIGAAYGKHPEVSDSTIEVLRKKYNIDLKLKMVFNWPINKTFNNSEVACCIGLYGMISIYRGAFALIAPYEYEGFAYTVAEAQSLGVPVIAGPGIPEDAYIDGLTGIKVDSLNPVDYANAIYFLMNHEKLYNLMRENSRVFSKRFDVSVIGQKFETILNSIIEAK